MEAQATTTTHTHSSNKNSSVNIKEEVGRHCERTNDKYGSLTVCTFVVIQQKMWISVFQFRTVLPKEKRNGNTSSMKSCWNEMKRKEMKLKLRLQIAAEDHRAQHDYTGWDVGTSVILNRAFLIYRFCFVCVSVHLLSTLSVNLNWTKPSSVVSCCVFHLTCIHYLSLYISLIRLTVWRHFIHYDILFTVSISQYLNIVALNNLPEIIIAVMSYVNDDETMFDHYIRIQYWSLMNINFLSAQKFSLNLERAPKKKKKTPCLPSKRKVFSLLLRFVSSFFFVFLFFLCSFSYKLKHIFYLSIKNPFAL